MTVFLPESVLKQKQQRCLKALIQQWESTPPDWESLLHIPLWEYHLHMTRAPLTLSHLARRLPTVTHTECLCVCAYVSWTANL